MNHTVFVNQFPAFCFSIIFLLIILLAIFLSRFSKSQKTLEALAKIFILCVFFIAILSKMEILAIIAFLLSLFGTDRIKIFLEKVMANIEDSPRGTLGPTSWDKTPPLPPQSTFVKERESGISDSEFNKYFARADFALKRGDFNRAKELFEITAKIDPNDFETHFRLGYIYNLLKENKKSIEHSKKALAIQPSSLAAQFNLAVATNHLLGSEKSLPEYLKAEKIARDENIVDPITLGKLNIFIGHDYREEGELEEAIKRYDKAIEILKDIKTEESKFWLEDAIRNKKILL